MLSLIFIALLITAIGASNTPQPSVNIIPLSSGVTVVGTLAPTSTSNAFHGNVYSYYLSETASKVTLDLTSNGCTLFYSLATGTVPCSPYDYTSGSTECVLADTFGVVTPSQPGTPNYSPAYYSSARLYLAQWAISQNGYIFVGRNSSADAATTCTYNLTVTVNNACVEGTVATYYTDGATVTYSCSLPYYQCDTNPCTITGIVNLRNETTPPSTQIIRTVLPQNTGYVHAKLTASVANIVLSGKTAGTHNGDPYSCQTSTSVYNSTTSKYIYELTCYTPTAGVWYFDLQYTVYPAHYSAKIEIDHLNCDTGYAGSSCEHTLSFISLDALQAGISESITVNPGDLAEFYFDVPQNYVGPDFDLNVSSSPSANGIVIVRNNAAIEDVAYSGYDVQGQRSTTPVIQHFTQFDLAYGGRYYVALGCSGSVPCTLSVTSS